MTQKQSTRKKAAAKFVQKGLEKSLSVGREDGQAIGERLLSITKSVSRLGTKKIFEFFMAIPMFIKFVIALYKAREKFPDARKKLLIIVFPIAEADHDMIYHLRYIAI